VIQKRWNPYSVTEILQQNYFILTESLTLCCGATMVRNRVIAIGKRKWPGKGKLSNMNWTFQKEYINIVTVWWRRAVEDTETL
jgi:hypothetical protein